MPIPSRELSVEIARSVLDAVRSFLPYEAASETPNYVVWGGGFVARCCQLASGMATLVEHGDDESVGALYRTLLETSLSGAYALLGRQEALEALGAALLHETHQIEVALGRVKQEDRPDEAERLPISDYKNGNGLIERVDRLLAEHNEDHRGWAPDLHRYHYRVLSLQDAHGGLGSLKGHIDNSANSPTVVARRGEGHAVFLLHHAIAHVGGLAALWALEAGLDVSALRLAMQGWEAAQPDAWEPPSSEAGR